MSEARHHNESVKYVKTCFTKHDTKENSADTSHNSVPVQLCELCDCADDMFDQNRLANPFRGFESHYI